MDLIFIIKMYFRRDFETGSDPINSNSQFFANQNITKREVGIAFPRIPIHLALKMHLVKRFISILICTYFALLF